MKALEADAKELGGLNWTKVGLKVFDRISAGGAESV